MSGVKTLLYNALQRALGDFVVGLTPEHLRVGLWSGKIELKDLEVNGEAVRRLGLPVAVDKGIIRELAVRIPWSRLGSEPVRVAVRGVVVVVSEAGDAAELGPEAVKDMVAAGIARRLGTVEDVAAAALDAGDSAEAEAGYVEKLVARIVDNLEVEIEDVHCRVEAKQGAGGLVLRRLSAHACDADWAKAFVDRSAASELLRNAAALEGCGVYFSAGAAAPEAPEGLLALVPGAGRGDGSRLDGAWVVEPIDGSLKVARNEALTPGAPRYDVTLALPDRAELAVRAASARALKELGASLALAARRRALLDAHPVALLGDAARPVAARNARSWWRYAARLACAPLDAKLRLVDAAGAPPPPPGARERYDQLLSREAPSEAEAGEQRDLERALPFEVLARWRRERVVEQRREERERSRSSEKRGWFGWGRRKDQGEEAGDDVSAERVEELLKAGDPRATPPGFEVLRLEASAGCRIAVAGDGGDLLQLRAAATLLLSSSDERLVVDADLQNLEAADPTGALARAGAAKVLEPRGGETPATVRLERTYGDAAVTSVKVRCSSYAFCYHRPWVDALKAAFASEAELAQSLADRAARELAELAEAAKRALAKAAEADAAAAFDESARTFVLDLTVGSPVVLVPRAWDADAGRLVLDAGVITTRGGQGDAGGRWRVGLEGAALRLEDAYGSRSVVQPLKLDMTVDLPAAGAAAVRAEAGALRLTLAPADVEDLCALVGHLSGPPADVVESAPVAADHGASPLSFEAEARLAAVEVAVLEPDRSERILLAASEVRASLASRRGGMDLGATLGGLSLRDVVTGREVVVSYTNDGAAGAAELARTAFRSLPSFRSDFRDIGDALVSVSMRTRRHPEDGLGTDLDVAVASLRVSVGASDVRPLRPFVESLFRGLATLGGPPPRADGRPAAPAAASGFRVAARLGELALTLRDDEGPVATAALLGAAASWASTGASRAGCARVCRVEARDARRASAAHAFRELVAPWGPGADGARERARRDLVARSSGDALAKPPAEGVLLAVDYVADGAAATLSAAAKPLAVTLLLEPIGAAAAAAAALGAACAALFGGGGADAAPADPAPAPDGELVLLLELPAAEVVLVEDAAAAESPALVARFGCGATRSNQTRGRRREVVQQLAVHDLSLALAAHGLERAAHRVVSPTTISLKREEQFEGDEAFDSRTSAHSTDVDARLAYSDLVAILAVLKALGGSPSEEAAPAPGRDGARGAEPGTGRVVTAAYEAKLAGLRLLLVDDALGPAVPLVDLRFSGIEASLAGPTADLEGGVAWDVRAACFNEKGLCFEPLVKPYAARARVKAALDAGRLSKLDVEVAADDVLEVVLSTAFAERVALLGGRLATGTAAQRNEPAFGVENLLATPLEAKGKTGDWRPVRPGDTLLIGADDADARADLPRTIAIRGPRLEISDLPAARPAAVVVAGDLLWLSRFDAAKGRVAGELRSLVAAANNTDCALEVCGEGPTLALAPPGETPLPRALARKGARLRLRRAGADAWTSPIDAWGAGDGAGGRKKRLLTAGAGAGRLVVVAGARASARGDARVSVFAPAVVDNRLPCGALVTFQASNDTEGRVAAAPGRKTGCCSVDVSEGAWVSLRVGDLRGRASSRLVPSACPRRARARGGAPLGDPFKNHGQLEIALRAPNGSRVALVVAARAERRHRALGLCVILEAPLWALDRSGLRLEFPGGGLASEGLGARAASKVGKELRRLSTVTSSLSMGRREGRERPVRLGARADLLAAATVASPRAHEVRAPARPGDYVYADSDAYAFTAVPVPLDGAARLVTWDAHKGGAGNVAQNFFSTASRKMADAGLGSQEDAAPPRFIALEAGARGLDVYVAVDARCARPGRWLVDAFERTQIPLVLEKKRDLLALDRTPDHRPYQVWVRRLGPRDSVDLGPNEEKTHYLVFLRAPKAQRRASAVEPENLACADWLPAGRRWPGYRWASGPGRALLATRDCNLCVGSRGAWSSKYCVGTTSFPLALACGGVLYDLEARPSSLAGAFAASASLVTVAPRFGLRNVDRAFSLVVRQRGDRDEANWSVLGPGSERARAWHWPDARGAREVDVGVQSPQGVAWALAPVALDVVAGHALLAPGDEVWVVRVEVRLNDDPAAAPYEAVTARLCVDRLRERPLFALRNRSCLPVHATDRGRMVADALPRTGAAVVGFAGDARILRVLAAGFEEAVDLAAASGPLTLFGGRADARVVVEDGTRVLDIADAGDLFEEAPEDGAPDQKSLSWNLGGVAAHVVDGLGHKRAASATLHLSRIRGRVARDGATEDVELRLGGLQVDSHAAGARWPVLLRGVPDPEAPRADVLELAAVRETHACGAATLRYLAARVLQLEAAGDSKSLGALGAAWATVSAAFEKVARDPAAWAEALCGGGPAPEAFEDARAACLRPRGAVDAVIVHPVQATVSFAPADFDDEEDDDDAAGPALALLATLAEIDRAEIKLKRGGRVLVSAACSSRGARPLDGERRA